MSKVANLTFDEENQKVEISGLKDSVIEISYESDVDFTELVSLLTGYIDSSEEVTLEVENLEDQESKLGIVVQTIQSIFEKYTESLEILADDEERDLPFPGQI